MISLPAGTRPVFTAAADNVHMLVYKTRYQILSCRIDLFCFRRIPDKVNMVLYGYDAVIADEQIFLTEIFRCKYMRVSDQCEHQPITHPVSLYTRSKYAFCSLPKVSGSFIPTALPSI